MNQKDIEDELIKALNEDAMYYPHYSLMSAEDILQYLEDEDNNSTIEDEGIK